MKMKLRPLGDRVLIERDEMKTETDSGILLPDMAQEKPREGNVIAVGWKEDDAHKHGVKPGDRVMLPKYGGIDVEVEGLRQHSLISEDDILGVLEPVSCEEKDGYMERKLAVTSTYEP